MIVFVKFFLIIWLNHKSILRKDEGSETPIVNYAEKKNRGKCLKLTMSIYIYMSVDIMSICISYYFLIRSKSLANSTIWLWIYKVKFSLE